MKSITNEQAVLLREQRRKAYELQRQLALLAVMIDKPECPHQKLELDLEASKECDYCKVTDTLKQVATDMEMVTTLLDEALLNGPMPQTKGRGA